MLCPLSFSPASLFTSHHRIFPIAHLSVEPVSSNATQCRSHPFYFFLSLTSIKSYFPAHTQTQTHYLHVHSQAKVIHVYHPPHYLPAMAYASPSRFHLFSHPFLLGLSAEPAGKRTRSDKMQKYMYAHMYI
ncbi:hypothetical protein, unlikely [Trypanosoma brucei gambiense DAL972]|uniref:Uncharacterized protein n=1 Tax=Trypanosoma brucei gambiense (strain MHOM/CI/86/DAL972) TaxID=679716 RepID=D0A631_TRYB9|nr:hypothetical protein, unlikely [Trypanosoma brucei gambiense DAL972]CBH17132.1 hypothetical protein, unlikely [Trypanosoma brucei gambiense DAL972]|eukprot:XP_011779396.1 hypothetical protein, unlikely [Trypanosoma brucei gambiense DAL972]